VDLLATVARRDAARLLTMLGLMLVPLAAAAVLLFIQARLGSLSRRSGVTSQRPLLARCWRGIMMAGVPLVSVAVLASQQLPELLGRYDDGLRGARVIGGRGGKLVWAPSGPGWNSRSASGDYLSWSDISRHEDPPLERCAYLSEDGTALLDSPVRIWRLPTASEIISALSRGGSPAGCTWDGASPHAECRTPPHKETPLWAPDEAPISYWSGQEASSGRAFAVNYTGGIGGLPASVEGLGVGFRCVRSAAGDKRL
jgi:hypothetical protein